ncbi:hypothetical protein DQ04_04381000 [Trypanosoma grayi]|uniref:hypothetical protein n=1 Tax=Trypanosoma grayi TaxID=71804 RepID=UPI0004F40A3E|nr:hypothetical protein DQ04_04381000 [Trypanosoma grayi]KEG09958.1 hypothetical protein DQ04_04381000 [Trypanosoma grayi]
MFYSGWKFPTPQRLAASGCQQDANYFVQETCSPGICLLHSIATSRSPGGSSANAASRRDSNGRIHLKSDVPIHPNSGVFYFEVEVRSTAAGAGDASSSGGGGLAEPELVIGVCRESLPPHSLPGEEACSIGLFTAQRMVYMNGRSEGEAVRFPVGSRPRNSSCSSNASGPQEERRTKGVRVGDTVGCIVNLLDGTVQFTFNGELLDVGATLSRSMPSKGYYPAVGMFRFVPAVSLRVVFQPSGRSASIPRPVTAVTGTEEEEELGVRSPLPPQQETMTAAAGYFVFNLDKYCEGIAEELLRMYRQKAAESEEGGSCTCRDAKIIAAIRKHLAARGMTKALSAFEKEQEELHCSSTPLDGGAAAHSNEDSGAKKPNDRGNKASGSGSLEDLTAKETHTAYSLHIKQLLEDIGRGDMLSATHRIIDSGVISPQTLERLVSAVEDVTELSGDFWGVIFFAQRRDILFLLRAAYLVEVALNAMEKGLSGLLAHVTQTEEQRTPESLNTAEFMQIAFRVLLEPFGEASALVKRQQRASMNSDGYNGGVRTIDEAAFGMLDGTLAASEARWPGEDLAAHLFFTGMKTLWSGPEGPVTMLVRRSVPSVPPPNSKQQQRLVQTLSMLVSHQHAVCARVMQQQQQQRNISHEWIQDWVALVEEARAMYRARCWCLLLHAIEDFNGALEYRLLVWLRKREWELHEAEKGGGVGSAQTPGKAQSSGGRRLFPSLRAVWRHVHAAAAMEPLLHVVTNVFSDKLHRATAAAQFAVAAAESKNTPSTPFGRGPKRGLSFASVFAADGEGEGSDEEAEAVAAGSHAATPSSNNGGAEPPRRLSCYNDDVRLSFLYMKSIYRAVFA